MDLRYSIRTVRNDLAFKVYGISDKVRDYCYSLRNDERRAISNVLEYIPTPSLSFVVYSSCCSSEQ